MAAKRSYILAVLGALSLIFAVATTAKAEEGVDRSGAVTAAVGRRLRPAEYSRDELESIDLFMALLLRIAGVSLGVSLALPVAVPLLVEVIEFISMVVQLKA